MPSFHDHAATVVQGEGLFHNGGAAFAVQYLNSIASLDTLESEDEKASRKAGGTITYSLFAQACATPAAAEKVRKHLDSGILHKLCKKMITNYFNPLSTDDYTCHGFVPMILGACAMSHGCESPLESLPGYHTFFDTYRQFLCGIFETCPMMDGARMQMKKALHGPDTFKPGASIDFTSYGLSITKPANAKAYMDGVPRMMMGGMPVDYKPLYKGDKHAVMNMVGPCSKEDMRYGPATECGGCQKKLVKAMICNRCKDQGYCSKECQRKDFRRHKEVCRTPKDAEIILGKKPVACG
ncbi:hypothetical protein LTR27_007113 [Elasticomyces elasticus]|nr:hypothetical protein LTR27_007113 [Elasticomyces elasticus]